MKKKFVFYMMAAAFALAVGGGCDDKDDWDDNDADIEVDDDWASSEVVILKNEKSMEFKFCLLNEQGKPATVFKEGENFSFYFHIKNLTGVRYYYRIYLCAWNSNFFLVNQSSGEVIGKSYETLPMTDIGIAAYPFENGSVQYLAEQWLHQYDDLRLCEGNGEKCIGDPIIREPLKRGMYYTEFSCPFKFHGLSEREDLVIDTLHFRINFNVK